MAVPVFGARRDEADPALALRHFVEQELLGRARSEGTGAVVDDLRKVLHRAVADGARVVLCTCSTIGGIAEAAAAAGVPGCASTARWRLPRGPADAVSPSSPRCGACSSRR